MDDLVKADIFFFITSLAVVLVTAGVLVIFYYIIPVARDVRDIVGKVRKAGDEVEKDFETLRANIKEEGTKGKILLDAALSFITRKLGIRARKRKEESE